MALLYQHWLLGRLRSFALAWACLGSLAGLVLDGAQHALRNAGRRRDWAPNSPCCHPPLVVLELHLVMTLCECFMTIAGQGSIRLWVFVAVRPVAGRHVWLDVAVMSQVPCGVLVTGGVSGSSMGGDVHFVRGCSALWLGEGLQFRSKSPGWSLWFSWPKKAHQKILFSSPYPNGFSPWKQNHGEKKESSKGKHMGKQWFRDSSMCFCIYFTFSICFVLLLLFILFFLFHQAKSNKMQQLMQTQCTWTIPFFLFVLFLLLFCLLLFAFVFLGFCWFVFCLFLFFCFFSLFLFADS